jgi:hypothetical protein
VAVRQRRWRQLCGSTYGVDPDDHGHGVPPRERVDASPTGTPDEGCCSPLSSHAVTGPQPVGASFGSQPDTRAAGSSRANQPRPQDATSNRSTPTPSIHQADRCAVTVAADSVCSRSRASANATVGSVGADRLCPGCARQKVLEQGYVDRRIAARPGSLREGCTVRHSGSSWVGGVQR